MQGMKLRARYKVVGPKLVKVQVNKASIDPETKSLQQDVIEVEKEMWMVFFPAGHSIRVDKAELVRLGFHIRPRVVDMMTGDVVDMGGDEFDLDSPIEDHDIRLLPEGEDDDLPLQRKR